MAAITFGIETLAALVEPGDRLLIGERPDDFVTVLRRDDRPTYVKLTVADFEHNEGVARLPRTKILHLVPEMVPVTFED